MTSPSSRSPDRGWHEAARGLNPGGGQLSIFVVFSSFIFFFGFSIHLITILRSVSGLELSPLRAACCQASCFLHRRTLTSSGDLLQQKCHSAIVWTEKSVSHSGLPSSLDCGSEPILPAFLRRLYTTLCLKVIHIHYTIYHGAP